MTNWMTVAGLALLVGGVATLIGYRSELFGSGGRDDHETTAPPRSATSKAALAPNEAAQPPEAAEPAWALVLTPEAEPTEVVLSWPPMNDGRPGRTRRPKPWPSRDVNSRPGSVGHHRAVFPGGTGELPTVLESRPQPCPRAHYVSRHAADPSP